MPKSIIRRTEQVEVAIEGSDTDKMVFEVKGFGATDAADFFTAARDGNTSETLRICLTRGVVKVVSGLVDGDGKEVNDVKGIDLGEVLTLGEANVIAAKVMELSELPLKAKKT